MATWKDVGSNYALCGFQKDTALQVEVQAKKPKDWLLGGFFLGRGSTDWPFGLQGLYYSTHHQEVKAMLSKRLQSTANTEHVGQKTEEMIEKYPEKLRNHSTIPKTISKKPLENKPGASC